MALQPQNDLDELICGSLLPVPEMERQGTEDAYRQHLVFSQFKEVVTEK